MMLGEEEGDRGEGSFGSKNVWQRISVIAAGPVFNFIMAFVCSLFIIGAAGYDAPVVLSVSEGYPAQEAGIEAGDTIVSINGKKTYLYRQVSDYVTFHQDRLKEGPITVVYEHEGERKTVSIQAEDTGEGRYIMGISGSSSYRTRANVWSTIKYSAIEVGYWIETTWMSLGMMLHGGVSLQDVSGPVGVVSAIGETYQESRADGWFYVWLNMLNMAILLSANLGVMNLLPFPALDGGRLVFLILEAIRGKRLDPELEGKIHLAGLAALMGLMVIILFSDINKLL